MRFVCESCRAQYMINDDKVGPKGVKVRCRKCGYVITVKRAEAVKALAATPTPLASDPDDAMATQVMQTPLVAPEATLEGEGPADLTNPLNATAPPASVTSATPPATPVETEQHQKTATKDSFLGADDDEIGAVFDQVLKTGPSVVPKDAMEGALGALGDAGLFDDDRQMTKVIDAATVAQLARESGVSDTTKTVEKKLEVVPETNWFVAINEKQTGPLTLEKVKEHWDRGEIGPDSLCWREGYGDWIPLSEVNALASVLAPKPPKPIMVPTAVISASPSVMSVPVQSAFSAGGMVQTMQSEVQVPMPAVPTSSVADREESGAWRPSAASALASMVKDEMEALARPAPKPVADEVPTRGLLDVPDGRSPAAATVPERVSQPAPQSTRAPTNPYIANPGATYSAPALSQYRPPSNRGLIIGLGIGGLVLLLTGIGGVVVWVANRQPVYVVPPPPPTPVVVAPTPTPTPTPVAAAPTPTPVVVPPTPTPTPVVVAPTPPPVAVAPTPQPVVAAPTQPRVTRRDPVQPRVGSKAEAPVVPEPTPKGGGDDDFESAFGNEKGSRRDDAKPATESPRPKVVVIPPAPGGAGEVKESLGQGEIMEVVLANRPALLRCGEEQRKREPGTSGKLVMKWVILTSGKVSNVNVVTEEFKGSYMAQCVGALIKSMVFPRHKQPHEPVEFPFKF
jgi:predicted Zn finger-like uncharacterized protein